MIFISSLFCSSSLASSLLHLDLDYISLRGSRVVAPSSNSSSSPSIATFFNIPYAEPPTGSLRFQPPKPPKPTGLYVHDATKYGPICMQDPQYFSIPGLVIQEDCLNMNVYVPFDAFDAVQKSNSSSGNLLPVAVYLYGGGFTIGFASHPQYNGSSLLFSGNGNDFKGVIVTFNYRVGVFGFAKSRELADRGLLNLGLKDMVQALEWVQKHISLFGGDPDNVTIFGQSAGAYASGALLLAAPLSPATGRPLFHRVMMESGGPQLTWATVASGQEDFTLLLQKTNCHSSTDPITCLQKVPASALLDAAKFMAYTYGPVLDGDFIKYHPITQYNRTNPLPTYTPRSVLINVNRNDGNTFTQGLLTRPDAQTYLAAKFPFLTSLEMEELVSLYPYSSFSSAMDFAGSIYTEHDYFCPLLHLRTSLTKKSLSPSSAKTTVTMSQFDHIPRRGYFHEEQGKNIGVYHGAEVQFLWALDGYFVGGEEVALSRFMVQGFSDFVSGRWDALENDAKKNRDGDSGLWHLNVPACSIPYGLESETILAKREKCAFWWRVYQSF